MAKSSEKAARIVGPVAAGPCRGCAVLETADGARRVEYVVSAGPQMPVSRLSLPLPPGGDVIALHWHGPSAVMSDGGVFFWQPQRTGGGGAWHKVANLLAAEPGAKRAVRPFTDIVE
jgi:hypothetical protein